MTGLQLFTLFHVAISLVGIGSGLVVIFGFLIGAPFRAWNVAFLATTMATSVTGFFFPFKGITPGIIIGTVSIVVLAIAFIARRKGWMRTYITSVSAAEFFNVLVLIVQLFEKLPALHRFAPKGNEPIISVIQVIALIVFVTLAFASIRRSRCSFRGI